MSLIELNRDDVEEEEEHQHQHQHQHQHHPYRMDLTAASQQLIDFAHQRKIVAVVVVAAADVVGTGVAAAAVDIVRYS